MLKTLYFFIFLLCVDASASLEKDTFSSDEFQISKLPKDWNRINLKNRKEIFLALQSKSKDSSFTMREFENSDPSLKKNVISWLRDYKSYGFKIISSKPIKLNEETYGYQINAIHKKSKKVFNQYMSIKNKKLLVLTCQSNKSEKEFLKCNESLASFSWKKIQ